LTTLPATLSAAACAVLSAASPDEKVALSRTAAQAWRDGTLVTIGSGTPPQRPARPDKPLLLMPRDMPKRKFTGGEKGRVAMLHALAHIELNAIDLAWDLIARFGTEAPDRSFFDDWVGVADEETLHFDLLTKRLADFSATYGDLPAHDGLWQAAEATSDDLLARLAVVPMVLEARGLDVTPTMIAKLERVGDQASAQILERIYEDEIGHVRIGNYWFSTLCRRRGLEASEVWPSLVRSRFTGTLKPPFNVEARTAAGIAPRWYEALVPTR